MAGNLMKIGYLLCIKSILLNKVIVFGNVN